tara:strand:- start:1716 stop:2243 length:528 start_codon:yes stop_codon:yes gene_type:complete
MNGFEINKIVASVILTLVFVFGIGRFADFLYKADKPEKSAFKVEESVVLVAEKSSGGKVEIGQLLAMGDIEHGQKVFKKCSACHMIKEGGKNMIGPNLWGVLGRETASISGYKYSKALAAYGKKWTFDEMNGFLIKPSAHVKGTKMAFAGLKKDKDRASVILYMNAKSNSPLQTP